MSPSYRASRFSGTSANIGLRVMPPKAQ